MPARQAEAPLTTWIRRAEVGDGSGGRDVAQHAGSGGALSACVVQCASVFNGSDVVTGGAGFRWPGLPWFNTAPTNG